MAEDKVKHAGGAPLKMGDPEIRAKLLECFERGSPISLACLAAGICETVFYRWQASDAEFSQDVKRARGGYAQECLDNIRAAGVGGAWQASATYLERQYPDEFSRRERHEVTGASGGPLVIQVAEGASDEEVAAAIVAALGGGDSEEEAE
jgi:hypothetical protein